MLRFLADRARQAAVVAFFVTSLAFVLIHAAPGDPFAASGDDPPEVAAARAQLRKAYGFDESLPVQYGMMFVNFARGRFGPSISQSRPVRDVLAEAFPRTFVLMLPALVIGIAGGAMIGTLQAAAAGRWRDRAASALALGILAFPEFLLAVIVSGTFAVRLRWFPATGMASADASGLSAFGSLADVARHAALPVATLALIVAAIVSRYQRAEAVRALHEEFVRAARARGAGESRVLFGHVLRRTSGQLWAIVGLLFPALVGGAALVEMVFGWPGAGSTLIHGVMDRDYPLVIALVCVGSVAVCVGSIVADVGAALSNPRVRLEA